jgi:hypothetical protein
MTNADILGVIISCGFPQIQGRQQIISEGFSDRKKKSVGLPESCMWSGPDSWLTK